MGRGNSRSGLNLNLQRSNVLIRQGRQATISEQLKGRTIEGLLATGQQLLIRTTDGHEVRISWRDDAGRMQGVPLLDDVKRWK